MSRRLLFESKGYCSAGVLIVFWKDGEYWCLLGREPSGTLTDPGGKVELEDVDAAATASRETHQEIGMMITREQLNDLPHYSLVNHGKVSHVLFVTKFASQPWDNLRYQNVVRIRKEIGVDKYSHEVLEVVEVKCADMLNGTYQLNRRLIEMFDMYPNILGELAWTMRCSGEFPVDVDSPIPYHYQTNRVRSFNMNI